MHILQTERLLLRWFRPDDADFLLALLNEPAWIAGIRDSGVRTPEAALAWMQSRLIDPCWLHGHGFWLVERRVDREPLGLCGIFKRDTLPLPDLGYGFLQRHWGQGYAREAARACRDYARQVLGLNTVLAITSPTNAASEALLADLGFGDRGLQDGAEEPTREWLWQAGDGQAASAPEALDALMTRLLGAFDNRAGRIPTVAALPAYFTPDAIIQPPGQPELDVRSFMAPRAEWLFGGRLHEFHEWELSHTTEIEGDTARRESSYAKDGWMDGQRVTTQGRKWLDCVRDERGRWRIARLTWQDQPTR